MIAFRQLGKYGRLGNQMFQIAATMGIAHANDTDYGFNKWEYERFFKKPLPEAPSGDMIPLYEKDFSYSSYEIAPEMDYELLGYFQSEKYWIDIKDEIMDFFEYSSLRSPYNSDTISIHIRRGDYLKSPEYHTNLTLEYYEKALSLFPSDDSRFILFTDDRDWCVRHFNISRLYGKLMYSPFEDPIEDMRLMSQCDHNIIANSSFSWWGAYLNKNPDKIVVTPKNWFGPKGPQNTKDLIPESWVQI